PNFGMPYANMGLISVIQERYSEAILLYEKSIKLLADNEEKAIAYNGLGNAFRAVGDYDSAIKSFRKAAELDPYSAGLQNQTNVFKSEASVKSPTFWADLGTAFLDNCSFNEAITALNKAIELNSNDGQVLFKLGKAYSYSGRYKEAILAFSNSVELLQDDKEKANSLNHLGNAYRKLNDYDKAIESFRKAVVLSDEGVTLATRARFSLLSNCRAEKV
ncbi:MAG: tetratricopeptide repeat protein, partial [Chloroflexota bacterium]